MLQSDCFSFHVQEQLITSFFLQNSLVVHLQSSLWVTSLLTLQYLATLARKNLCVPATSTQAEGVYSWMGWLLKKEVFVRRICQQSTCNYSWRTVFSFRLDSYFTLLNLSFVENYHISIFTTFAKQSMVNRLSNPINRNRSTAKVSKVTSSSI